MRIQPWKAAFFTGRKVDIEGKTATSLRNNFISSAEFKVLLRADRTAERCERVESAHRTAEGS